MEQMMRGDEAKTPGPRGLPSLEDDGLPRLSSLPAIPMAVAARGMTPPPQPQVLPPQRQFSSPGLSGAPGSSAGVASTPTGADLSSAFLLGGHTPQTTTQPPPQSASPWWALTSPPQNFALQSMQQTVSQLPSPPLQPLDPPSPEPQSLVGGPVASLTPAVPAPQQASPPQAPRPQPAQEAVLENVEPQLTLSTYKIYKFRPFKLVLTLNSEWRKRMRLTEDGVVKACLNAKCCREGSPEEELRCCSICCQTKRIIEVAFSGAEFKGPEIFPDGTERYCFDQCRTNCSSSRDHHRGRLMLKIDKLPGWDAICSAPFVLQAREKQRPGKARASLSTSTDAQQPAAAQSAAPADVSNTWPSPPVSQAASVPPGQPEADPAHCSPGRLKGSPGCSTAVVSAPAAQETKPIVVEGKCVVRMYLSSKSAEVVENICKHFQTLLEKLPGYSSYSVRVMNGTVVTFSWFDSPEHAMASMDLAKHYVSNDAGYENLWHCNLHESNILTFANACRSW